jgi:ABC-type sulfate transport system permease component
VESVVGQVGDFFYASPVVVFLLGPFSERVVVVVHVSQDTGATSVQVIARVLLRVTRANTLSNGFGSALVVGGVGGVYS